MPSQPTSDHSSSDEPSSDPVPPLPPLLPPRPLPEARLGPPTGWQYARGRVRLGQPLSYGQPPPGSAPPPPPAAYTPWGVRVVASLVDLLVVMPLVIPARLLEPDDGTAPGLAVVVLYVAASAVMVWNLIFRQGRTGQTIGKEQLKIALVRESDGQALGPWRALLRQLAHFFDGLCYIGYLWPLWDPRRQTFADKIVSSIVIPQANRPLTQV